MEIICIEEKAFFELFEKVMDRLDKKIAKEDWDWIDRKAAMNLLGIRSNTTLQHLRNEGKILYSHPQKKLILYSKKSIAAYLESNKKSAF